MTVGELIAALRGFPYESEVVVFDLPDGSGLPVCPVEAVCWHDTDKTTVRVEYRDTRRAEVPVMNQKAVEVAERLLAEMERSGYGTQNPHRYTPNVDFADAVIMARAIVAADGK